MLTSERLLRLLTKVGVPVKSLYEPLIATVARVGLFFIKSNDAELLWVQSDWICELGIDGKFIRYYILFEI